jgi:hypothetical protein
VLESRALDSTEAGVTTNEGDSILLAILALGGDRDDRATADDDRATADDDEVDGEVAEDDPLCILGGRGGKLRAAAPFILELNVEVDETACSRSERILSFSFESDKSASK